MCFRDVFSACRVALVLQVFSDHQPAVYPRVEAQSAEALQFRRSFLAVAEASNWLCLSHRRLRSKQRCLSGTTGASPDLWHTVTINTQRVCPQGRSFLAIQSDGHS